MKGVVKWILLVGAAALLCVVSGLIGAALSRNFGASRYTLSYADFISVMLTAISLLMTLLAMFIAVLGLIGWNAIANRVRQTTEDVMRDGFKEGNPLHQMFEKQVEKIMFEGVDPINSSDSDKSDASGVK